MKKSILVVMLLLILTTALLGTAYGAIITNNDTSENVQPLLIENETYNEYIVSDNNKKIIGVELKIKTLEDLERHKTNQSNNQDHVKVTLYD